MQLAVSNIAWGRHDDPLVLKLLQDNGVKGIEVAPTKLWQDWDGASYKEADKYKRSMLDKGFELPAMQAILFGKPELQVFDKGSHRGFFEHLKLVADLANGFGSKVLIFGAPKNRKRGQFSHNIAMDIATEFFYQVGEICLSRDCCLAIEHNPVEYGCDFITNVHDAKELVDIVAHRGFKLHLDSAGIHMCGGNIAEIINSAGEFVHYHISEPMLEPIVDKVVNQQKGIDALYSANYNNWVSIEMKVPASIAILDDSVQYVKGMLHD